MRHVAYTDDRGNRVYVLRRGTLEDFPRFRDLPTLASAEQEQEKWELMHRIAEGYTLVSIDDAMGGDDFKWWECGECHHREKGRHYRPCSIGDAAERLEEMLGQGA